MRSARQIAVGVAVALCMLAGSAAAALAAPRASVTDIEDEVMCPVCGTLLELADSPQARREKAFIARLARRGDSKSQIKQALVRQYGPEVLALPEGSGFDLAAYLVPIAAVAAAAAALGAGVMRWRRAARQAPPENPPAAPEGADAERLDADIARYDL